MLKKGEEPYLVNPNGEEIRLKVENMVPVLVANSVGDGKLSRQDEVKEQLAPAVPDVIEPRNTAAAARRPPLANSHYLTHHPKDSRCEICMKCKVQRKQ